MIFVYCFAGLFCTVTERFFKSRKQKLTAVADAGSEFFVAPVFAFGCSWASGQEREVLAVICALLMIVAVAVFIKKTRFALDLIWPNKPTTETSKGGDA